MPNYPAALSFSIALTAAAAAQDISQPVATFVSPQTMAASRTDVWAEAAIRSPGGPSYEKFADLLPPLRYANTAFRNYPLVLCAPAAQVKARWISNGSGVNLRAEKPPMWREVGTPVELFVGADHEPFGRDSGRTKEPHYASGYLPVVQVGYEASGTQYEQEAFAPVGGTGAEHGAVLVRLTSAKQAGEVIARIGGDASLRAEDHWVCNEEGQGIVGYGSSWKWNGERRELTAQLAAG